MYGNLEGITRVTFNAPGSLVPRCEAALFRTFTVTFSFTVSSIVMIYCQQQTKLFAAYQLAVKTCDGGRQHEVERGRQPPRLCWSDSLCVSTWH